MIDFELSEEQVAMQEMARKFAENEIRPVAVKLDKEPDHPFPRDLVNKLSENGFFNMFVPEKYGGLGFDKLTIAIVAEELAWGDAGINGVVMETLAVAPAIEVFGTEEQKEKFFPPLTNKEKAPLCSLAVTEPNAGSDITALSTTAELKGDHYIFNGTKRFATNAGVADLYLVIVTTDKSKGRHGQSAFLVTSDTPGLSIGKEEDKMGQRLALNAEVIFEDAVVPKENLLGKEGDGGKVIQNIFNAARPAYSGAGAVGVARAAFEYALKYSKEREQFGKPIFRNQAISFRLAEMATMIESARLLVWEASWALDQGKPASKLVAMAKYFSAEVAMKVTTDAVQTLGGYGYMRDYPVEKYMRDAKVFQIYLGTGEIQRLLISRDI